MGGGWGTEMSLHRIGGFRYGLNTYLATGIAYAGPLANLVLALILKPFYIASQSPMLFTFIKINLWYAVFSMVPIPPLDGSTAFFGARSTYMLLFGFIMGAALMIYLVNSFWIMLFGTILFGIVFWFIYFMAIERVEIG